MNTGSTTAPRVAASVRPPLKHLAPLHVLADIPNTNAQGVLLPCSAWQRARPRCRQTDTPSTHVNEASAEFKRACTLLCPHAAQARHQQLQLHTRSPARYCHLHATHARQQPEHSRRDTHIPAALAKPMGTTLRMANNLLAVLDRLNVQCTPRTCRGPHQSHPLHSHVCTREATPTGSRTLSQTQPLETLGTT